MTDEKSKLKIFDSGLGYPVNFYGGPNEWAENWAAAQRAAGKTPTWRDFVDAAKATGWPSIVVPNLGIGNIPLQFLEWVRFERGGVYFIEGGGRIKIGVADSFPRRFRDLQSHSPITLTPQWVFTFEYCVVETYRGPVNSTNVATWAFEYERGLHRAFAPFRIHGEWFDFAAPIREFLTWAKIERPDHIPPFWPDKKPLCARAAQFVAAFERDGRDVPHLAAKRGA